MELRECAGRSLKRFIAFRFLVTKAGQRVLQEGQSRRTTAPWSAHQEIEAKAKERKAPTRDALGFFFDEAEGGRAEARSRVSLFQLGDGPGRHHGAVRAYPERCRPWRAFRDNRNPSRSPLIAPARRTKRSLYVSRPWVRLTQPKDPTSWSEARVTSSVISSSKSSGRFRFVCSSRSMDYDRLAWRWQLPHRVGDTLVASR